MPGLFPLWGCPHQKERQLRFEGHKCRQERRGGGRRFTDTACHWRGVSGEAGRPRTWARGEAGRGQTERRWDGHLGDVWSRGEAAWKERESELWQRTGVTPCRSVTPDWRAETSAGSAEPRKLLGRAGRPCPPCWVLCLGRTVLVGQEQRKGTQAGRCRQGPHKSWHRLTSGSLQLGGSGWKKKVTVTEGEPKARAAGAWLARLPLNIPDLAHRGSANTWEWTNRKTGKAGLGDKLDIGSGKVDLPELCPEFSSLHSCEGQWCHRQMQGTWRGRQESAFSPEVLGSVEWMRVMTGPCTTGSLHWPASPSSGPCTPTPSSWVLPQAGTLSSRWPPD